MAAKPTTDAVRVLVSLDPVMAKEVDERKGKNSRPQFILKTLAKAFKLKQYEIRQRGKAAKGKK